MTERKNKSFWRGDVAQDRVLRFVSEYWKNNYRSPTYREIAAGTNAKSTAHVYMTIGILEKSGKIMSRNIQIGKAFRQIIPVWVMETIDSHYAKEVASERPAAI